jgi:hypothetical protein
MKYVLKAIIGTEPLTAEQTAEVLRIEDTTNSELPGLITAAREAAEGYTGLDFVKKDYYVYFDDPPAAFTVDKEPLVSLEGVTARLKDGTQQDIAAFYEGFAQSGVVVLKEGAEIVFNGEIANYDAICFTVRVGQETVPEKVMTAIKWYIKNAFYSTDPGEWMEAFKTLLRGVRRRHV